MCGMLLCCGTVCATAVRGPNGHYYKYVEGQLTFSDAQAAAGPIGHLTTITSAGENDFIRALIPSNNPAWIGATDDANDTDTVFDWVTGEAWAFTSFLAGEPDDDISLGGTGEALFMQSDGTWGDTNPNYVGFVAGYIVEYEPGPGLTSLEIWRYVHFDSTADSGQGADLADPDHDGLSNLIEYAFDTNPLTAGDASGLPEWTRVGGDLTTTFTTQPDITYIAEQSTSLAAGSWVPIANSGTSGNPVYVVPTSAPRLFLRVRVTNP